MPIKSITQSVSFHTEKSLEMFVRAIERSEQVTPKKVVMSRECARVNREQIKDFFKDIKSDDLR